jgi:pyrroloquinoline quinone biosynthesis protein E
MSPELPLPVPQPDQQAYAENLRMALESSEKRRLNYQRLQARDRAERMDTLPAKLDFENVSRCNFRCPACQVSIWENGRRAADMTLEAFKAIIDDLGTLVEIKLQGMGEPLLQGDPFFDMIRYARSQHIWVRTTTNASLLHLKDNAAKLIDSGVNEVQISVDGATAQTFQAVRVGSRFAQVVANCKLVNAYCNERDLLRTRMWTVVQQLNLAEFLDLVELGADLGFRRITFAMDLHGWGQEVMEKPNAERLGDVSRILELAPRAIERGRARGVEVTFWRNTTKYSSETPASMCPWPFERAFVSSDLRIVPCCMIGNPEVLQLGDATSFVAAWNAPAYREFRRAHLSGRIPGPCTLCYQNRKT